MKKDQNIEKMIEAFRSKSIDAAIDGFATEHNDEITNSVRAYLDKLPADELASIQDFLKKLLNYCYDGALFEEATDDADQQKIANLSEKEKFLLKESAIYFYGRLQIPSDISVLKKIYEIDDDKHIKLNATFASLQSFEEDLELDFVDKILSDPEYDLLIRSWTMAFFKLAQNPYKYIDKETDDWSAAKTPRIKRLSINNENEAKFQKAMSFRLLDLAIIYLFVRSRGGSGDLTDAERQVIKDARVDYEKYSAKKIKKLQELKELILA